MPNTIAKYVLEEYLATPEPRYALLINAPWGAGKTEFIKKQTQYDTQPGFLYMSLFGIDSSEAFYETLVAELLNQPGDEIRKNFRKWTEKAKNVVSGSQFMGFSINLNSISLLEGLKKDLPGTLIFDDLERISMPQSTMSGLLNNFIEHERKRVILIANTEQINEDEKVGFETTREKHIGESIEISPDIDAALQSYWVNIPEGHGKEFLQKNQVLIKNIFREGKHGNLRLLRYSVQTTAKFLNKVDPSLYDFQPAIEKLTGTFLALHMAYSGGKIGKEELGLRRDSRAFGLDPFGKAPTEKNVPPLIELAKAHPNCDIRIPHYGSPLPLKLTTTLLAKGYSTADDINEQLRRTPFFSPPQDKPDWVKLWHWGSLDVNELTEILSRLDEHLVRNEITDPGVFVQIYGAMHWIAGFNGLEQSQEDLSRRFLHYIETLSKAGKIEPCLPPGENSERYIFEQVNSRVTYKGYAFETDTVSTKVVDALKHKMEKVYEDSLNGVALNLLETFETDTYDFIKEISPDGDEHNYSSVAILHLMDSSRFADRLLKLLQTDHKTARVIAVEIGRRFIKGGSLEQEKDWINSLVTELRSKASAKSRVEGAQIKQFIQQSFSGMKEGFI